MPSGLCSIAGQTSKRENVSSCKDVTGMKMKIALLLNSLGAKAVLNSNKMTQIWPCETPHRTESRLSEASHSGESDSCTISFQQWCHAVRFTNAARNPRLSFCVLVPGRHLFAVS